MKVPTTIEALIRKPQTRAEELRDADIHILLGLYTTRARAATADWTITINAIRFFDEGFASESVECRNFDEVYEYLANYAKPDRMAEAEAEGEDDE